MNATGLTDGSARPADRDLAAFREGVRRWLAERAPRRSALGGGTREAVDRETEFRAVAKARAIQAARVGAGLAGRTWPKEYGGQGLSPQCQRAFIEEAAGYDLGTNCFNIAFGMVGPTILEVGTDEQKNVYIPRILRGENTWCQLFSEPGAGSDV